MAALFSLPFLAACGSLAVALAFWIGFGRLVQRAAYPADRAPTLPLALCAGMGAWVLTWVLFVPLAGGDTVVALPLFGLMTLALGAAHLRHWARDRTHDEHFFSVFFLHLLMLCPWLAALAAWAPATVADFGVLQTLAGLRALGHWPNPGQLAAMAAPGQPMGVVAGLLAPATPLAVAAPLGPLFNLALLAAAAGLVAGASGRAVRWSNLLLLAAASLPVALLVPSFDAAALPRMAPALAAPVALMAILLPLATPGTLATGWAALPAGLAALWLAAVHPLGAAFAVAAALAWLLRGIFERGPTPRVILGASWVAAPPLLFVVLLAATCQPWANGLGAYAALLSDPAAALRTLAPPEGLPALAWWQPPLLAALALLNIPAWLALPRARRLEALWPLLPFLFLALPLLLWAPGRAFLPAVLHAFGLVLLVAPLRLWESHYPATGLAAIAYRRPWGCGLALLFPLMGLVLALTPLLRQPEPPLLPHMRDISADLSAKMVLSPGEPVAAIGFNPLAAAALAYGLGGANPVEEQPEPSAMAELHPRLRDRGYAHALLAAATARRLLGLKEPVEASVLFATTPDGMVVRGIYPLPLTLAPGPETR